MQSTENTVLCEFGKRFMVAEVAETPPVHMFSRMDKVRVRCPTTSADVGSDRKTGRRLTPVKTRYTRWPKGAKTMTTAQHTEPSEQWH
jgi:hypothetical protein